MNIALITIITRKILEMTEFYRNVLGFKVKLDLGRYVEFENEGVRFAICKEETMFETTEHNSYRNSRSGQSFELAFPVEKPEDVDLKYNEIIDRGATPIKSPRNMSWGQRTAFFADPDGNIHELFSNLRRSV